MLYFFTPYSFGKKLFEAIDSYMNLIHDPEDWICLLDGDTAFLLSDFGHQIQSYIDTYPDTGLFTCFASRCHYSCQLYEYSDPNNTDIQYHRTKAEEVYCRYNGRVKEINRRIAGHLMVIQKKTWLIIREEVLQNSTEKLILGVDTKISNAILKANLKIHLMRGIYIFHYLRLSEGINNTSHLI
jgi:GT2 family glycosyltransferase